MKFFAFLSLTFKFDIKFQYIKTCQNDGISFLELIIEPQYTLKYTLKQNMFLMGHTVYSPLNKLRLLKNRNLICHTKNTKGLRGPIDSPLCVRASVSHRLSLEPYDGIF